ncbi:MAG: effector protein, partial [Gammaproteobacteria bacterium]|nr:effector protein [Gammaproteobacteria bacterium]
RARVLHLLKLNGATIYTKARITAIDRDKVSFHIDEKQLDVHCKQVIIAMGAQPDDNMMMQLQGVGAAVHRIGDCREVGYIDGAILDARQLVQKLELP